MKKIRCEICNNYVRVNLDDNIFVFYCACATLKVPTKQKIPKQWIKLKENV